MEIIWHIKKIVSLMKNTKITYRPERLTNKKHYLIMTRHLLTLGRVHSEESFACFPSMTGKTYNSKLCQGKISWVLCELVISWKTFSFGNAFLIPFSTVLDMAPFRIGSRMEFNADGDDSFVDVDVSSSSGLCEHSSMYGWLVVWC